MSTELAKQIFNLLKGLSVSDAIHILEAVKSEIKSKSVVKTDIDESELLFQVPYLGQ